ncbi:MAG: class I SAM-dependent methyltransferase, partial [Chitinophagaceae bacterium]
MPASEIAAFDGMAAEYDASFSKGLIGKLQRAQVRRRLSAFLKDKKSLNILEINCGTGDDALWLSSLGHHVLATDASGCMIKEAKNKIALMTGALPEFRQCAFQDLPALLTYEQFDLVFSNFSGLNCIPAGELEALGRTLDYVVKPGGHIAAVIFGKYCCWEMLYYGFKFKFSNIFRRWKKKGSVTILKEEAIQPVYYYSTNRFCGLINHFNKIETRPVGLFIH